MGRQMGSNRCLETRFTIWSPYVKNCASYSHSSVKKAGIYPQGIEEYDTGMPRVPERSIRRPNALFGFIDPWFTSKRRDWTSNYFNFTSILFTFLIQVLHFTLLHSYFT
jgi:hypothetical protein